MDSRPLWPRPIDSIEEPRCTPPNAAGTAGPAAGAWQSLDAIDLLEEMRHPVPTLQHAPPFMRAAVRAALVQALAHLRSASGARGSAVTASRAWKLFLLTPRMMLARTPQQGSQGRAELLSRAAKFQRGEWPQLLRSARQAAQQPTSRNEPQRDGAGERERRRACAKVRQGEVF